MFGEIVEPNSRILWDDDYTDFVENERTLIQWKNAIPTTIDTLFIVETPQIIDIVQRCILFEKNVINKLEDIKLEVYNLEANNYLVVNHSNSNRTYAEVSAALISWLEKAKKVICLTSQSIASYQTGSTPEPSTFVRHLSSKQILLKNSQVLKPPNLVTGFGAAVLTYCLFKKFDCTLFVIHFEAAPLDSINTRPVLDLLRIFYVGLIRPFKMLPKAQMPESNIYT